MNQCSNQSLNRMHFRPFIFLVLISLTMGNFVIGQTKIDQDREAIKAMCGCFDVTFNFAETFQHIEDSLYRPSPSKKEHGVEWAELVEDSDNKISIQHILVVNTPNGPHIVKHWRQDWIYENQDIYDYHGDNLWKFTELPAEKVSGQWTQKVYQVDDSPRYEGSATWTHVDGKSFWENSAPAPLPRREITIRSDYNLMLRGNRVEITDEGWVHDQDNHKILRSPNGKDQLIAEEKGFNTYQKIADGQCAAAVEWWQKENEKWAIIRNKWDDIFERKQDLSLAQKVDHKVLYKHLFAEQCQSQKDIHKVIDAFVLR